MTEAFIALGFLLATLLVAVFFSYIYSLKRQSYLLLWTTAWTLYSLHYLYPGLAPWIGSRPSFVALNEVFFGFTGLCFFAGTQLYTRRKPWIWPCAIAALILVLWAIANSAQYLSVSSFLPSSLIFVTVGLLFWKESRHHE